ncbi:MAG: hypothetical protein FD165_676 [Gammaproteobacteria bacterium]|nr:MAG: hypothetical protein FD165_676 [Gammaproteobacteria bacterium]TND07003.1 MAG: hypothetical protein FD120_171 [Gammaproteobacteria bacterium]
MVAFMLYDARVKSVDFPVNDVPVLIPAAVPDHPISGNETPHAGNAQTPFPAFLEAVVEHGNFRIDQHGGRHRFDIRVTRIGVNTEYDDTQPDSDLRSGQPGPVGCRHRIEHIANQGVERRGIKLRHRDSGVQQRLFTDTQNLFNGHRSRLGYNSGCPAGQYGFQEHYRTRYFKIMIHILTVFLLAWFTGSAYAAEGIQWFEVELIVFKYTSAENTASERWPADPGTPSLQDAVILRPPSTLSLKSGADGKPELAAVNPAIAHRFVPLSAPGVPVAAPAAGAIGQGPTRSGIVKVQIYPEPFELIDEKSLRLAGALRSLRRSTAYEPLLHVGWVQPGTVKNGSVYISAGTAGNKTLEGIVQVNLSRYLHLAVDLVLREADLRPASMAPAAAAGIEQALNPVTTFRLTESRRMRSQELHYFDHPKFGVIAQITPYEPPVIEMSVPAPTPRPDTLPGGASPTVPDSSKAVAPPPRP